MIVVLVPTAIEAGPFLQMVKNGDERPVGRRRRLSGNNGRLDLAVCICGIGQVNTSQTLTSILEKETPDLVILCGCAGAFAESGLHAGDVAAAASETFAELGIHTAVGMIGFEEAGFPIMRTKIGKYYGTYPTAWGAPDNGITTGPFLTVATISGTPERTYRETGRYNGDLGVTASRG